MKVQGPYVVAMIYVESVKSMISPWCSVSVMNTGRMSGQSNLANVIPQAK